MTTATAGFMTRDVTTQVQGMVDATNHGFSIRDQTEGAATSATQQFESSEGAAGNRPELIVTVG